eukprot:g1324.t1
MEEREVLEVEQQQQQGSTLMEEREVLEVDVAVARRDGNTGRHYYIVNPRIGGYEWTELRRYRDFSALRASDRAHGAASSTPFPPKTPLKNLLGPHDDKLASRRCVALEKFLRHAIAAGTVARLSDGAFIDLQSFLGVGAHGLDEGDNPAPRGHDQGREVAARWLNACRAGRASPPARLASRSEAPPAEPRDEKAEAAPMIAPSTAGGEPRARASLAQLLGISAVVAYWACRPHMRWLAQLLIVLYCIALPAGW